jgi:hypothetical protein
VASELIWMYWRRDTCLSHAKIQAPGHPACIVITVPAVLLQVLVCVVETRNIEKTLSKPENIRQGYLEIKV